MSEGIAAQIAELPPAVAGPLSAALAPPTTLGVKLIEALGAAGLPKGAVFPEIHELTPVQRRVVDVLLAGGRTHFFSPYALPMTHGGLLARWAGAAPGGILETTRIGPVPLWKALQQAAADSVERMIEILETLPFATQLEAIGALAEARYLASAQADESSLTYPHPPSLRLWRELRGEGGDWARAWLTAHAETPSAVVNRACVNRLAFLALGRAGIPIEPAWERLFWIGGGDEHFDALTRELVRALPEARRVPVVLAQMDAQTHPHYGALAAAAILPDLPSPEILEKGLAIARKWDFPGKKATLAQLAAFAKASPVLARAVKKGAPVIRLRSLSTATPRDETGLDDVRRQQLRAVAAGFVEDDASLTPARLLADGLVEHHVLGDTAGAALYDVWIVTSDTGGIFRVGTTTEVAPIIQASIELADPRLKSAIVAALRPARAAKKPSKSAAKPVKASAAKEPKVTKKR